MKLTKGTRLTYVMQAEAWYTRAVPGGAVDAYPRLTVQASYTDGQGVAWEFDVEELDAGGPSVRLSIFDDACQAIAEAPEFFAQIASQRPASLESVAAILRSLGAADVTARAALPRLEQHAA